MGEQRQILVAVPVGPAVVIDKNTVGDNGSMPQYANMVEPLDRRSAGAPSHFMKFR